MWLMFRLWINTAIMSIYAWQNKTVSKQKTKYDHAIFKSLHRADNKKTAEPLFFFLQTNKAELKNNRYVTDLFVIMKFSSKFI